MMHSEDRFEGCGGRSIYFQCWQPDEAPRAIVILAHGAGEHGGRYLEFAQYFCAAGIAVAALDHNGHGHSEGTPGHVDLMEDYLFDLKAFQAEVARQFPQVPLLLVGHSLGGLIASLYLLQSQGDFVGAVLSGAAVKSELQPGFMQTLLIRVLAVVAPKIGILQLDAAGVSRDPEVVRKYVEDPLVHHGKMSVRKLRELFRGMTTVQDRAGEITLPILILHGGADAMTDPNGSRFLHEHIGSEDKTLKIYPGLYHEIFNEPERADVMADALNWCNAQLAKP
jgi:alpha-beta hydrolase superfamily lysophospholipase